jgi:TPR repeat protein
VLLWTEEAANWTRRAAEQGYPLAETDLGNLYEQGKGVSPDYVTAYIWYSLGAADGDHRASLGLKPFPN